MFITEKFWPFVLAVLLVFPVLIGCSDGSGDSGPEKTPLPPDGNFRPSDWQPDNIWTPEKATTSGKKLQDIYVFYRNGENLSATSSNLDPSWQHTWNPSSAFVQDTSVTNSGKRVYRANSAVYIQFPLHDWNTFSLGQYYNKGYIEFDIRGVSGNVSSFTVGLQSKTKDVEARHMVNLSNYASTVTTSWQHVKISIKDITDTPNSKDAQFSIENIWYVVFDNVVNNSFYISDVKITSEDGEIQYPVIKVNQTGYRPNDTKYALISYFPSTLSPDMSTATEFRVINKAGVTKKTGTLTLITNNDAASGEKVLKADFSDIKEPGEYYVSITSPMVSNSFKFTIDNSVYGGLFVDSIRYFYYQRQGLDLDSKYAGIFARKNLHPNDTKVKKWSERSNGGAPTYDLSKGWYDAGDFGKYLLPASTTVSDLLFAYETFPSLFADKQLNIPESGNGVPDFLDEIKWELDMMLKFEDGTTGGFWHVANYSDNTIYIVDTNGVGGAGNTKSTSATAGAAGVLAHAYIVYKDIPQYKDFAEKCLAAAKRAWTYLQSHTGNDWVDGAGRKYQEDDRTVNIMRFWAACALYRATGEAVYNNYVTSNYTNSANTSNTNGFAAGGKPRFDSGQVLSNGSLAAAFIHYTKSSNPTAAVVNEFRTRFNTFQNGIFNYYTQKNWPTMLVDWGYWWGSNDPICRSPSELYLCNLALGQSTTDSVNLVRDSVHYILGMNPMAFSFVSGYGPHCVKNIYSGIYSTTYDKTQGFDGYSIPPGYMAGGANMYDDAFMSNWGSKSYVDSDGEWTTNENAIYWNAIWVLLLTINNGTAP